MASSIANLLSVDAGAAPSLCIASYKAFAVGDKNTGTRREKLFVILKHKITTGHMFPHCAHPIEMFLASRHTACLCSQTAADNPLDLLALPAQHRHKNTTIRDACMYCKNEMTLLSRTSFEICMSRIMNTHEAKMFHWNTSDLDFALNHLRCADHFVEFQQILNCRCLFRFCELK